MDFVEPVTFILIKKEDFELLKSLAEKVLHRLDELIAPPPQTTSPVSFPEYITAKQFMNAVGIKRTKFDKLIASSKIKTIKKSRRIKVLATEVKRYFEDPSIQ